MNTQVKAVISTSNKAIGVKIFIGTLVAYPRGQLNDVDLIACNYRRSIALDGPIAGKINRQPDQNTTVGLADFRFRVCDDYCLSLRPQSATCKITLGYTRCGLFNSVLVAFVYWLFKIRRRLWKLQQNLWQFGRRHRLNDMALAHQLGDHCRG